MRTFANEAEKADWAVVYYSGHGMEVNGTNYLIPVEAKIASDRDVQFEAIPLDQVMAAVEGAKKLKLVLLDACRDNPFVPQMRRTAPAETVATAAPTAGGVVGHAFGRRAVSARSRCPARRWSSTRPSTARPRSTAKATTARSRSPWSSASPRRMSRSTSCFALVRDDVMEATAGRQEPYTYGSLPGREDFFFVQR